MLPCAGGGHNYDEQVFDGEMGEKETEVELEASRSRLMCMAYAAS